MWSLLGPKTQLTIILGAGFTFAWGYDWAYEYLTGQAPNNIKLISLIVFIIGVVFAGVVRHCLAAFVAMVPTSPT